MTLLTEFSQLVTYRTKRGRRNRMRNQSLPPATAQDKEKRRSFKERFRDTTLSKNIDYLRKPKRELQRSSSESDLQYIQNALKEMEEESRLARRFQESKLARSRFARNVDYLQSAMTRKSEALSRSVHGSCANYHNMGDDDDDFVPYEESLVGFLQGLFVRPESPLDYEVSLSSSSEEEEEGESILSRNMAYLLDRRDADTVARKKAVDEEVKTVPEQEQEEEQEQQEVENVQANPQEEQVCNPQDVSSVSPSKVEDPKKEFDKDDTKELIIANKECPDKGNFAKNVDYLQAKAEGLTKSVASFFTG